jgi:hypothetical protein
MKQGYSGSTVRRIGNHVEKISNDQTFIHSKDRQNDLFALSRKIDVLPDIIRIDHQTITMDYVEGREGLTINNARKAGEALRILHNQRDYPHPCMTGLAWLIQLANDNLGQTKHSIRLSPEIITEYPTDALIHAEPVQFIEKNDGQVVFIDFEGIGTGSSYQDLGFIYYMTIKEDQSETYNIFMEGYQPGTGQIAFSRVKQIAGIISLAYARFAEFEKRMRLGAQLLAEAGQG